jgi:hypothetical protein
MLEGLVALRTTHPTRAAFDYAEVAGQVARVLVPGNAAEATREWNQQRNAMHQQPNAVDERPDNRKLLSALWSLVGAGYVWPRLSDQQQAGTYSVHVLRVVTSERLDRLATNADAHPLHPGFLARFQRNTPTATDEVVAYLEDAVSCAEGRLYRPALMMVGVANEQTIRVAHAALVHLTLIAAPAANAGARALLAGIQGAAPTWQVAGVPALQTNEQRHRLNLAVTFSEALRVERNNVAHPGAALGDEVMVEQMLMGFAHHAGAYWEIVVRHAVAQGFQL